MTPPHQGAGHIASTQDPGWCVYCGLEIAPPWDWTSARQAVIVRAATAARRQRQARLRRAEWRASGLAMNAAITRAATSAAHLAAVLGKESC